MISVHLMTVYDAYETNQQNSCKKLDSTLCECEVILLQNATQSRLLEVFYSSRSPCSLPNRRLSKAKKKANALVAVAKRFCSVLCCLIFNWPLHLGTLRLQLLRPQLRGCSVRQASLWTPNGTSCVHLLLISCCSSERLTFWVCASYPGSRDLVSVYISDFHVYK